MKNLHDVMIDLLKDTFHAEKQLVAALPKMAKAADSDDLREAFKSHLEETRGHVEKLEEAFRLIEMKPTAKMCHGMKGLIEEGAEVIGEKDDENAAAIDAALIAAAQKVEHYEIVAYGTLATFADTLGMSPLASIFKEILGQEEATDEKLTKLAEGSINAKAMSDEGSGNAEDGGEDEDRSQPRKKTKKATSR